MTRAVIAATLLTACGGAAVTGDVSLQYVSVVSPSGEETRLEIGPERTAAIEECLAEASPIDVAALGKDALPEGEYRVSFTDGKGSHTWTLLHREDLAAGTAYYRTTCLHGLLER